MSFRGYLRMWGKMPAFDEIFQIDSEPNSSNDNNNKTEGRKSFFYLSEPPAYLGSQPRFNDFLNEIDSEHFSVLDVGCGKGEHREKISKVANYVGVDFNKSYKPEAICDLNTERLPFEDNTFDFFFSDSVLEHIMYPQKVMKEIYRVMKPGGRGYLLVPFFYKTHGSPYDFFRYSKGGMHFLLKDFKDIEIYPIGGVFSVLCHILWNFGRIFDRFHVQIGNLYRIIIWCIFRILNYIDKFDVEKIFTRGHYAFFSK